MDNLVLSNHQVQRTTFLILGGNQQYIDLFAKWGNVVSVETWTDECDVLLDNVDAVVFTGGSDVSPSFYNRKAHKRTHSDLTRDSMEAKAYQAAAKAYRPMIGICRGAQFLTVMNNGELIQDINGHTLGGTHPIVVRQKGKASTTVNASSTHHQMMYPFNLPEDEYVIIGSTPKPLSDKYETMGSDGRVEDWKVPVEPEIVFYPYTDCLCIQGHPEFSLGSLAQYRKAIKDLVTGLVFHDLDADDYRDQKIGLDNNKFANVNKYGNVLGGK